MCCRHQLDEIQQTTAKSKTFEMDRQCHEPARGHRLRDACAATLWENQNRAQASSELQHQPENPWLARSYDAPPLKRTRRRQSARPSPTSGRLTHGMPQSEVPSALPRDSVCKPLSAEPGARIPSHAKPWRSMRDRPADPTIFWIKRIDGMYTRLHLEKVAKAALVMLGTEGAVMARDEARARNQAQFRRRKRCGSNMEVLGGLRQGAGGRTPACFRDKSSVQQFA